MKRIIAVLLVLAIIFTLTGCKGTKQLNERLIIQGIGIDFSEDQYEVTLMYMDTDQASADQKVTHNVISSKGRTVLDTITNAVSQKGQEPLYSHNLFILLGKGLTSRGINDALRLFVDYYESRPTVDVFAGESSAKEIMTAKDVTPKSIAQLAQTEFTSGRTITSPLYKFVADMENETQSPVTASLKLQDGVLCVDGAAVFKDGKRVYTLNNEETLGVLLMTGKAGLATEVITLDGISQSFSLSKAKSEINISRTNENLRCKIKIKGTADLYEGSNFDDEKTQEKIEDRIKALCYEGVESAVKNNNADILSIGRILRMKDNGFYKSVDDWDTLLSNTEFDIEADIKVD